ncbi:MAG: antitoxin [Polyangia bacterium]
MRTTLTIDDELLSRAKRAARERRVTLGRLVEDALRASLTVRRGSEVPPFEPVTFGGDGARPGIDLDKTSQLLAAEDEARYGRE